VPHKSPEARRAYVRAYRKRYGRKKENPETVKAYRARPEVREKHREQQALYRAKNHEKVKESKKLDYAKKRSARLAAMKQYQAENLHLRREYQRQRKASDPAYQLKRRLGNRINEFIRHPTKCSSTMKLIGCDLDWLMAWLEIQFKPGMNWRNYGPKWVVDHVRPCASFELTDPHQQRLCFHFTNLQPLWAPENQAKGSLWQGERLRRTA
jgi:hypothetical protein